MKNINRVIIFSLLVGIVFMLFSCDLKNKIGIEERIDMFFDDVNNAPSEVYTNYHPDAPNYDNVKDYNNTLGQKLPSGNSYSHGAVSVSGDVATTTVSGWTYTNEPIEFKMKEGDDGWYVWQVTISGATY
ncbi:hypothetical protein WKV44_01195 [Spirochaetia bacterium 38H-sp]|uniref:Lipoprotein n=1 Tax=Rarispira pelagica TaxID=3141764 RepID=A0ABU9U911_9SPIR